MRLMIGILLLGAMVLVGAQCPAGQSLFNNQCIANSCFDKYLPRFKTVVGSDGVGRIPITFVSTVQYVDQTGDIEILLKFIDEVQADGTMKRDNTASCVEDKLFRFTKNDYTTGLADESATAITSTYDAMNVQRNWRFRIPGSQLTTKLIQDTSIPGKITYRGYYSFRFFVVGQQQVAYNFEFSVEVETSTKKQLSINFRGQVQNDQATCNSAGKCIAKADSKLEFCSDSACASGPQLFTNLYLNQRFWIRQTITTSGFTNYRLALNSVTYTGAGLSRRTNAVVRSPATSQGFIIIECLVDFAYSTPVTITVDSTLASPSRLLFLNENLRVQRILQEKGSNGDPAPALAESGQFTCMKCAETDKACPTEAEAQKCSGTFKSATIIQVLGMMALIFLILL